ncbi:MAG: hypothetical protein HKN36_01140 [Hellea sp.]|nr:hypothetical protein [Hellea sp.]
MRKTNLILLCGTLTLAFATSSAALETAHSDTAITLNSANTQVNTQIDGVYSPVTLQSSAKAQTAPITRPVLTSRRVVVRVPLTGANSPTKTSDGGKFVMAPGSDTGSMRVIRPLSTKSSKSSHIPNLYHD